MRVQLTTALFLAALLVAACAPNLEIEIRIASYNCQVPGQYSIGGVCVGAKEYFAAMRHVRLNKQTGAGVMLEDVNVLNNPAVIQFERDAWRTGSQRAKPTGRNGEQTSRTVQATRPG